MTPELSARLTRVSVDLPRRPGGPPTFGLLLATWTALAEKGVLDLAALDGILDLAGCALADPAAGRSEVGAEARAPERRPAVEAVDAGSEASFPASDPPSHIAPGRSGAPAERATGH